MESICVEWRLAAYHEFQKLAVPDLSVFDVYAGNAYLLFKRRYRFCDFLVLFPCPDISHMVIPNFELM